MECVIEQVVKSRNYAKEKRKSGFLLVLMVVFFVVFVLLECFGLTVSQIYYYTDRALFKSFMLYFALSALPIVFLEALFFILRRRLCVAFDYYFDGTQFKIIKSVNDKRKKIVAVFSNDEVTQIGRVDNEGYHQAFPVGEKRKPVICALNIDNPNIYYVKASAFVDGVSRESVIVIEPKKELLENLCFSCPWVVFSEREAWKEQP